jgi:cation:H+ antiporter
VESYFSLLIGVACAAAGGEFFVKGAVGLAQWARVSPGIVGVTVAAFATSSPELSVSVNAALAGTPEIALGDALGSNVVNVALILGSAIAIAGFRSPRDALRRDFPVALVVPLVTAVMAFDGVLSRLEGLVLFAGFLVWLTAAVSEARRQRRAATADAAHPGHARSVPCARGIAKSYGLDEFVIGATVVAVGTSVPELATTIMAKLRGHDEVGLGTILGSNLFNGLFIVSVAAMIHPIPVVSNEVFVALAFGVVALALTLPARDGRIGRRRGALLLLLYAGYLATVLV